MRGISAASRGTAVLRNWTRPRPSRKRITTPDGIGEASLNVRPPLPGRQQFSDSISETIDANYTGMSLRERTRPGLGIVNAATASYRPRTN